MSAPGRWTTIMLLVAVTAPQLGLSLLNPSTPQMALDLHTSISAVQLTLSCYMAGYAVSMFAAGVLADRFDARALQALGLVLFALGGVLAAGAPTVAVLGVARFVQAVGGTSATVLCRLVIQRRYPTDARMHLLTSLSIVIAATPALSPFLGSALVQVAPWRALFLGLAAVGLVLALAFLRLVPTAAPSTPVAPTPRAIGRGIAEAFARRGFHRHAVVISLAWMGYFLFIEQSAFILQGLHGATEIQYGLLLIVPALGYIAGSVVIRRAAVARIAVRLCTIGSAIGAATLILLAATGVPTAAAVVLPLAVGFLGVGAAIPFAQAGLLELDLKAQGVGAGLFFFVQMGAGALYSVVVEALHLRSAVSTSVAIGLPLLALAAVVWGTTRARA
ncbi:MFS transporter [Tsukamurella paurometabola]|uniref:Inner membrane transport protein ydhC n=1 Tax=Tsukamurella paurometabola TaxID=2061 RepID=A0A3P8KQS0_TSUPA|nr:MFS transporter [Tsukamurella paurometabola]MBS4103657.1 MFS transporter [Tsukamurella paurometabola]UEA81601.1 MFS transporter [Tsukamurella paurometabola]VDR38607.1 Inner membrane transport protein ydhC [Tsukamurella paurometabola]